MDTIKTEPNEKEPFTASSLAAAADIKHTYVARLCRQGKLEAKKFGSAWLIPYEVGAAWLEARKAKRNAEEL